MPKICSKCGREGDPLNLFCGMCGRPLFEVQEVGNAARMSRPASPMSSQTLSPMPSQVTAGPRSTQRPATASAPRETQPVGSFSILGLSGASDPTPSTAYLLEDDASSSHWGRRAVLFAVLLGGAAAAAWHWRAQLKGLETRYIQQAPAVQPGTTTYSAQSIATEGSEVAGTNPNTQVMTATQTQPAPASPVAENKAATQSGNQNPAAPPSQNASAPAPVADAKNLASTPTALDVPAKSQPVKKASRKESVPVVDSKAINDEAEGEKYLYGTGVPANCSQALKGLTLAAERTNAKAEGVLGTMYATGHCVTASRPMAYRWFAKALQQQPANVALERQMQVLWGQMTPDERRIAEARD
jgi:hypothetical protein